MKREIVKKIIIALFFVIFTAIIMYCNFKIYNSSQFIADVGGFSAFLSVFGTLFGILSTLILVEVWSQFNKTSNLMEEESVGLEKLYTSSLYFNDDPFSKKLKVSIIKYLELVIKDDLQYMSTGKRNKEAGEKFRDIIDVIKSIKFDDDHDSIIFDHIIREFDNIFNVRAARIEMGLSRIPTILKIFLYIASFLLITSFVLMPFINIFYGIVISSFVSFLVVMIIQIINDLDNPYMGCWILNNEAFKRALNHIENSYNK